MNWLADFYQWFWFHTEFWLTPVNRRPYTFIWRDWIFTHPNLTASFVIVWVAMLYALQIPHPTTSLTLGILSFFLLAHLTWGSAWIEGQQEVPEYLGEET